MDTWPATLTTREIALFQAMPGISALLLPDSPVFTILAVTDGYLAASGRQREDLLGKGLFTAFPNTPDDPEQSSVTGLLASLDLVCTLKAPHHLPLHRYDIPAANGLYEERWWSASNNPVISENGDLLYIVHTAADVTASVKAEQQENRMKDLEHAHALFMQAPVAIGIVKGSAYTIEMANDSLLEIWGRSTAVIGQPLFDAIPELNGQGYRELLDQVCATGTPFEGNELPIRLNRHGKEEVGYFDFVYKPYYEEGHTKPVGVFAVGHNVTEQVKARNKVQESEKQFSTLANAIVQLAWIADADGWINWYNDRWYEYTGTTFAEMQGWGWEKVQHPAYAESVVAFAQEVWKKGEPWELTFPLRGADGIYRWFLTRAVPIKDEAGKVVRWIGTNTNIDEQLKAQETLKEKEKELQQIFTQAPVSIVVYKGEDLVVQVASQKGLELWGKTEEEVIGRPFFDISPELREGQEQLFRQVRETGVPFIAKEFPVHYVQYGKPHFIYYDFVFQPLRNEHGDITAVVSIGNDVTHSVEARKKIEESESRFRTLAETLPQMIWVTDEQGKMEYNSHQWQLYSGIADSSEAWEYMIHPDDKAMSTAAYQSAYTDGKPFRYELRLKNSKGEYRWHHSFAEPVKDEQGKVVKWVGSLSDIHDQKNLTGKLEKLVADRTRELAAANQGLQRSNEDLQQFAHVASHDLKEPVRKVLTFSGRLKDELGKNISERAATYLSKIEGASVRMYSMIDGVLLYSSLNALEQTKELIDLEELMDNIQSDLEVVIQQKQATFRYTNLMSFEGSAILIYQLFYNLINNSLKFVRDGVPPIIELATTQATAEELGKAGINDKSPYLKLTLRDNGIGFANEHAKKIFGSFTRLHAKDRYEGTGLGLSLCRKIVERHRGAIWAEGKEGEGATFTIVLPES